MPVRYLLRTSMNNTFYFNLTADNNENIVTWETHVSKDGAMRGIQTVKMNSPFDSRYARLISMDGSYHFFVKAGYNETIVSSETYKTQQARENGNQAVKKVGPTDPVNDQN